MIQFFIKLGLVIYSYTYGIVPGLIATSLFLTINLNERRIW